MFNYKLAQKALILPFSATLYALGQTLFGTRADLAIFKARSQMLLFLAWLIIASKSFVVV